MAQSALSRTDFESSFDFYDDPKFVSSAHPGSRHFIISDFGESYEDLCNDLTKVVVTASPSIYHFWHEAVGPALSIIKKNPNSMLLIDCPPTFNKNMDHYSFFIDTLKSLGITYKEIDLSNSYKINNFFIFNLDHVVIDSWALSLQEFFEKIFNNNSKTFRKIYLINSKRVFDEEILIEHLQSKGFEAVVPEEIGSYDQQIKFFNEAKILISTTGSGLANSLFMQPGSIVVEIVTPLKLPIGLDLDSENWVQTLQYYYDIISFEKNHLHIRIPNHSGHSSDIINSLQLLGEINV